MTKKKILIGILCISFFMIAATGRTESACTIIDNLRSSNEKLVEVTCKKMGLDRGIIGLVKVQLISPHSETATKSFFVIGISWEGPNDGYLILMDKDGNIIHKKGVGHIKQLTLIQLKDDGDDLLLVDSIYQAGTGTRLDHYNIFSINNQGFLKLWDRVSNEISSPGLVAPEDNYDITAFVTFEDIDNDGILELIYQKRIVKYRYIREKDQFKAEPASRKTEIYKLRKINNKQQFTLEKQKGK